MKKNDLFLILCILIISILSYGVISFSNKESGNYVTVTVDGSQTATYPLNKNEVVCIPKSPDESSDYNKFEIKNGTVAMLEANCPDLICVHEHSIQNNGETIVCLPHRLVLQIVSETPSNIDAITN